MIDTEFYKYFIITVGGITSFAVIIVNVFVILRLLKVPILSLKQRIGKRLHIEFTNAISNNKQAVLIPAYKSQSMSIRATIASNAFIFSLCISNLLVGIIALPMYLGTKIETIHLENSHCKLYGVIQYTALMSNAYANVSIAIERFRCVVYKTKYNKLTIIINISAFYIVSFGLALSQITRYEYVNVSTNTTTSSYCDRAPNETLFNSLSEAIVRILLGFVIPLVLIAIFYTIILRNIKVNYLNTFQTQQQQQQSSFSNNSQFAKKYSLFSRTFSQIVIIWVSLQLPYAILTFLKIAKFIGGTTLTQFFIDFSFVYSLSYSYLSLVPYRFLIVNTTFGKTEPLTGHS